MEFTLAIGGSKWRVRAENADIAVLALRIQLQITAPIEFCEPAHVESLFADTVNLPADRREVVLREMQGFIDQHVLEISEARQTIEKLPFSPSGDPCDLDGNFSSRNGSTSQ